MMTDSTPPAEAERSAEIRFLRRVLITAAVAVLALLLWRAANAVLLALASVLVAVLLLTAAQPLDRLGLSRGYALLAAGGAILVALALFVLLMGSQLQAQFAELANRLPEAVRSLEQRLGIDVPAFGGHGGQSGGGSGVPAGILGQIATFGRLLLDALSGLVLAVVGGVFLAASPGLYRRGLVRLLPRSQHGRAEDTLKAIGNALRLWLMGQLIAMSIVGVLVGLGAWAIGLPAPLALGLFAGLAEFVPTIGSIVGAVPALLLALTQGTGGFLWTLALVVAVQQLESNIIEPVVQRRMVQIPPALLLFSVVAFGMVFGLPGVVLAAPLTVVAYVAVKKLYVRETLGEPTGVPGEEHD